MSNVRINHHFRMISEDWSNDAENSALMTGIKLQLKIN